MLTLRTHTQFVNGSLESKVKIDNGVVATMFSHPTVAKQTFSHIFKNDKTAVMQDGVIIQKITDKTDDEILKGFIDELKMMQKKAGNMFKMRYWVTNDG